jgi:glycosyltransferase involved in cell wall biosynthesis
MPNGCYACDAIITCHDDQRYLRQCLESVRSQTLKFRRVAVVDDASKSPAEIREICRMFDASYHRTEFRNGCAARDFGFSRTSSTHVLFLDADNFLAPTYLQTILPSMEPDCGIAYGAAVRVDARGNVIGPRRAVCEYDRHAMHKQNQIDTCAVLRRTAVEDAGLWSNGRPLPMLQDWSLMLRITALGWKVKYFHERLWAYRVHDDQLTRRMKDFGGRTRVDVYRTALDYAVVTPFCGRRWCLDNVVGNYKRLGVDPARLHGIFIDNSNDENFHAELVAKLLRACNEWSTVTVARARGGPVAAISNEELANTAAHRTAHAQKMGQHLARIYAVEARRLLPSQCAFVLTIEDDIEMLTDRAIPLLLEGMDSRTQAVSGIVRSRYVKIDGEPTVIAHRVRCEDPYKYERFTRGQGIQAVGATGMHCTLWRAESWDRHMPLYYSVNDDGNCPWHDAAFCARIRRGNPHNAIKIHWGLRCKHLHKEGDRIVEIV